MDITSLPNVVLTSDLDSTPLRNFLHLSIALLASPVSGSARTVQYKSYRARRPSQSSWTLPSSAW